MLAILPVEVEKPDYKIVGKTGSGAGDGAQIGWYVGYLERSSKQYAFASFVSKPAERGQFSYLGGEAKKIALQTLEGWAMQNDNLRGYCQKWKLTNPILLGVMMIFLIQGTEIIYSACSGFL